MHPQSCGTLLCHQLVICPGGLGSAAPKYELPLGKYTFYYLELALEKKLARKLDDLRRSLLKAEGTIKYDSSLPGTRYISSLAEFQEWQEKMGGYNYPSNHNRVRYEGSRELREVLDTFRGGEMEEEDLGKETKKKVVVTNHTGRTWYSPEAWQYGGLRVKDEVKEESESPRLEDVRDSEAGPSAKRARLSGR